MTDVFLVFVATAFLGVGMGTCGLAHRQHIGRQLLEHLAAVPS